MNAETWQIIHTSLLTEIGNTIYMVLSSAFIAVLIGLPLGVLLTITKKGHLIPNKLLHHVLGTVVNIGRSFPFAILMIALIPVTRWIVGTSLGTTASIVPLSIAAIPFAARLFEASLNEIDKGMIEAAKVMGSTTWQIIYKVMVPESLTGLMMATTTTIISLIGYSAMAGTMGGGGLGKIAIQYGYQRFNSTLMALTVIILIILVQGVQFSGNAAVKYLQDKRGGK